MTNPQNDDYECPHGIPWQFVKDQGCDECLNEMYEEEADKMFKREEVDHGG